MRLCRRTGVERVLIDVVRCDGRGSRGGGARWVEDCDGLRMAVARFVVERRAGAQLAGELDG